MSFLFGTNATIDIQLDNVENRQKVTKVFNQETNTLPVYTKSEDVTGKVTITMKDKKLEHLGIKIDFIGKIEYSYDKSATTMFLQQWLKPFRLKCEHRDQLQLSTFCSYNTETCGTNLII